MARWAGWGAGPAGAGSTGGPTRPFLAIALLGCLAAAVALARRGDLAGALVSAVATAYFAFRLFAGLGRSKE